MHADSEAENKNPIQNRGDGQNGFKTGKKSEAALSQRIQSVFLKKPDYGSGFAIAMNIFHFAIKETAEKDSVGDDPIP